MSTERPRTETIQISIDCAPGVMTTTLVARLQSLLESIGHDAGGVVLIRSAGGGRWSGTLRSAGPDGTVFEAVMGDTPTAAATLLCERIGLL